MPARMTDTTRPESADRAGRALHPSRNPRLRNRLEHQRIIRRTDNATFAELEALTPGSRLSIEGEAAEILAHRRDRIFTGRSADIEGVTPARLKALYQAQGETKSLPGQRSSKPPQNRNHPVSRCFPLQGDVSPAREVGTIHAKKMLFRFNRIATPARRSRLAANAGAACISRLRLVDADRSAFDISAVQLLDRCVSRFVGCHFDEPEPSRTIGRTVHDHLRSFDLPGLRKEIL